MIKNLDETDRGTNTPFNEEAPVNNYEHKSGAVKTFPNNEIYETVANNSTRDELSDDREPLYSESIPVSSLFTAEEDRKKVHK